MALTDASLTELVAELRERLRRFAAGPPGREAATKPPGPLAPAGRAALAARLLAVVVGAREGADAVAATKAFEDLAEALETAPSPLPGSAWEADLGLLAREFETLAGAWDRDDDPVLAATWRALRAIGDRLWAGPSAAVAAPTLTDPVVTRPVAEEPIATSESVAAADSIFAAESAAAAESGAADGAEVWLLVAGTLRRDSLRRRLRAAGFKVDCPADIETLTSRLAAERPAALICDDAAPTRYRSRLRSRLPDPSPPLILVRSRTTVVDPSASVWLPPYDTAEILGRLDSR